MRVIEIQKASQCPCCCKPTKRCECDRKNIPVVRNKRISCYTSYIYSESLSEEKLIGEPICSASSHQKVVKHILQEMAPANDLPPDEYNNNTCPRCMLLVKQACDSPQIYPINDKMCKCCRLKVPFKSKHKDYKRKSLSEEKRDEKLAFDRRKIYLDAILEDETYINKLRSQTKLKIPDSKLLELPIKSITIGHQFKTQRMFDSDMTLVTLNKEQKKPIKDKTIGFEIPLHEADNLNSSSKFGLIKTKSNLDLIEPKDTVQFDFSKMTFSDISKKTERFQMLEEKTSETSEDFYFYTPEAKKYRMIKKNISFTELIRDTQEKLRIKNEEMKKLKSKNQLEKANEMTKKRIRIEKKKSCNSIKDETKGEYLMVAQESKRPTEQVKLITTSTKTANKIWHTDEDVAVLERDAQSKADPIRSPKFKIGAEPIRKVSEKAVKAKKAAVETKMQDADGVFKEEQPEPEAKKNKKVKKPEKDDELTKKRDGCGDVGNYDNQMKKMVTKLKDYEINLNKVKPTSARKSEKLVVQTKRAADKAVKKIHDKNGILKEPEVKKNMPDEAVEMKQKGAEAEEKSPETHKRDKKEEQETPVFATLINNMTENLKAKEKKVTREARYDAYQAERATEKAAEKLAEQDAALLKLQDTTTESEKCKKKEEKVNYKKIRQEEDEEKKTQAIEKDKDGTIKLEEESRKKRENDMIEQQIKIIERTEHMRKSIITQRKQKEAEELKRHKASAETASGKQKEVEAATNKLFMVLNQNRQDIENKESINKTVVSLPKKSETEDIIIGETIAQHKPPNLPPDPLLQVQHKSDRLSPIIFQLTYSIGLLENVGQNTPLNDKASSSTSD